MHLPNENGMDVSAPHPGFLTISSVHKILVLANCSEKYCGSMMVIGEPRFSSSNTVKPQLLQFLEFPILRFDAQILEFRRAGGQHHFKGLDSLRHMLQLDRIIELGANTL